MDMQTHGQLPLMQRLKVRATPKASQSDSDIPEYSKHDATILAVVYTAAKGLKIRLDEGVQRRCLKSTTVRPFFVMPCCFCQKSTAGKNTFFLLLFFLLLISPSWFLVTHREGCIHEPMPLQSMFTQPTLLFVKSYQGFSVMQIRFVG